MFVSTIAICRVRTNSLRDRKTYRGPDRTGRAESSVQEKRSGDECWILVEERRSRTMSEWSDDSGSSKIIEGNPVSLRPDPYWSRMISVRTLSESDRRSSPSFSLVTWARSHVIWVTTTWGNCCSKKKKTGVRSRSKQKSRRTRAVTGFWKRSQFDAASVGGDANNSLVSKTSVRRSKLLLSWRSSQADWTSDRSMLEESELFEMHSSNNSNTKYERKFWLKACVSQTMSCTRQKAAMSVV